MRFWITPAILLLVLPVTVRGQSRTSVRRDTTAVAAKAPAALTEAERKRRRLDFLQEKTIVAETQGLVQRQGIGKTVLTSADEQTSFMILRREVSGDAEVHARWDDLVIVRAGEGIIEMGDTLVGSTYRGPGERRGGKFHKSYTIAVRTGDIVRIPAGVPHAFLVSGKAPLEYLIVKQRRQNLPIRWYEGPERTAMRAP